MCVLYLKHAFKKNSLISCSNGQFLHRPIVDRTPNAVERLEDSGWGGDEGQRPTEWGFRSKDDDAQKQGGSQRQQGQAPRTSPPSHTIRNDTFDSRSPGFGSDSQFDAKKEDGGDERNPGVAQVSRISQLRGDERVKLQS